MRELTIVQGITRTLPEPSSRRLDHWRLVKDRWMRNAMALGGIGVIIAISLIFFYLLYVVLPLFRPADMAVTARYPVPGEGSADTLYLATEEYAEVGVRVTGAGGVVFFRTADGTSLAEESLPIPPATRATAFSVGEPRSQIMALGLSDGTALVFKTHYAIDYPNDRRRITPSLKFPVGPEPIRVDEQGAALERLAMQANSDQTTLAAYTADGRGMVVRLTSSRSLLDGSLTIERRTAEIPPPDGRVAYLALSPTQRELILATEDGFLVYYDLAGAPHLLDRTAAVPKGVAITALRHLGGGISVLVGDARGQISQWFPERDETNRYTLAKVRDFEPRKQAIVDLAPEYSRKGFAAADAGGQVGLYHTTAERTLLVQGVSERALTRISISPRADALLALDEAGELRMCTVHNEHPEVSWRSLWGKVWYESRQQPEFIWQSSSASSDFEPKFSLTPLTFGTLKGAFYAMVVAIPIAVLGAIYTGYFMSPAMRELVKPTIEVMGALPTVILGFLAGLWLAPLIESHLPGTLLLLLMVPAATMASAWLWSRLPQRWRGRVPEGWEAALLLPVLGLAVAATLWLSAPLEVLLFGGDMSGWLTRELGLAFDQRNALVVGIAMGIAVIPLIFSISEDAIFSVPRHLTLGSLALGATPWQTLTRVVLLTASPGIFSAVMIGMGRAVGETMIVLMATGNTPVMDLNIFQGFRALSANVAVEMPESEVNSTHYRVLFLASLVLFAVTFLFNTVAEVVRQRLREKFSNL